MTEPVQHLPEPTGAAAGGAAPTGDGPPVGAHPVLVYTLQRIALLLLVGGVLYLVGVRGVWLILFAFLLSGFIAMVALSRSREGATYGITSVVGRVNRRIEASSRAEDLDDDLDDVRGEEPGARPDAGPAAAGPGRRSDEDDATP